jgi:hypothetical protein
MVRVNLLILGPYLLLIDVAFFIFPLQILVEPLYLLTQQGYPTLVLRKFLIKLSIFKTVVFDLMLDSLAYPELVLVLTDFPV